MLLLFYLAALAASAHILILRYFTSRGSVARVQEDGNSTRGKNTGAARQSAKGSATVGIFTSIKYVLYMFLHPDIPNYEVTEMLHKSLGLSFMMIKLPGVKQVLASVADLTLAKQLMTSPNWINHFRDDYYLYIPTNRKSMGILFGNGEYWRQGRTLALKLMHQLDFFKQDKIDSLVSFEVGELQKRLNRKIQESTKLSGVATLLSSDLFQHYTVNIVSHIVGGPRVDPEKDPVAQWRLDGGVLNRQFNVGYSVLEVFPWLRHIPGLTFFGAYETAHQSLVDYCKGVVAEKMKLGTYRTSPSDFLDYFLLEVEKEEGKASEFINYDALIILLRDMMWAGGETPSAALEHGILQAALNPSIQIKVQAEIDAVIGRRVPCFNDRNSMTYTQAVLLEVLRYSCPVPFTSRSPLTDTEINGEQVPKGSLFGINIYAISRSEQLWDDPHTFRPERFLSTVGKIVNTEKIIPFGYGKRQCIGEAVSRTTLFLFFVTLLQNFTFELPRNLPMPDMKNLPGISRCPVPYVVNIKHRPPTCS